MDQLRKLVASLSPRQRLSIVLAAILVVAGMFALTRYRREADFKPLYTGLAQDDAAAVVQKLKETGVEYRLSESGGIISVPSARAAELRLEMAAAGLPRSGRIGFEIFDKTNLGATEFVEHINYRRALEGELERSVKCLQEVEQARVHLTFPKDSVFLEARQPAKASVMLKLRPGARLSPQNVLAVEHLVGSAVEGLAPEAVSILDMRGNLLSRPRRTGDEDLQHSETVLEFRRKVEQDLLTKINGTLEPLLGTDRYRAGVSVECDPTSGEQNEEIYDPSRSVMTNSQKTEDVTGGSGSAGFPGTASNLPRPQQARRSPAAAGLARRTENITYQSSRVVKRTRLPQGAVKRISVAVLLDQNVRWEGTGSGARRVLVPPSPETLKTVRDLVAGIGGLLPDRGDQVVVESLPFENTLNQEPPSAPKPPPAPVSLEQMMRDPKLLLPAAGAGVLLILLLLGSMVFFFLKRRRNKKNKKGGKVTVQGAPALAASGPAELTAEQAFRAKLAEQAEQQAALDREVLNSIKLPIVNTKKADVLVKQLRDSIKTDSTAAFTVLQTWIREKDS